MHTRGNLSPTCISEPQAVLLQNTPQFLKEPTDNLGLLSWLGRRPRARRRARRLERARQARNQRLAWRVQDIFAGCGLAQGDFSVAVGHVFHIPQVVSVVAGPPVRLEIRTLPGQMPDDFAAQAPAIAYNLGVSEVRVVPLGPSLIRLELLPQVHPPHGGASAPGYPGYPVVQPVRAAR